jgi:hypothetical protein
MENNKQDVSAPVEASELPPLPDLVERLREYAANPGYSHGDYADTMREAAIALASQVPGEAVEGLPDMSYDILEPEQMKRNILLRKQERCDHDYKRSSGFGGDFCAKCGMRKATPTAPVLAAEAASVHSESEQIDIGKRLRRVAAKVGVNVEGDDAFYYDAAFAILGQVAFKLDSAAAPATPSDVLPEVDVATMMRWARTFASLSVRNYFPDERNLLCDQVAALIRSIAAPQAAQPEAAPKCSKCNGRGFTDAGDPETGATWHDYICADCTAPAPVVAEGEDLTEYRCKVRVSLISGAVRDVFLDGYPFDIELKTEKLVDARAYGKTAQAKQPNLEARPKRTDENTRVDMTVAEYKAQAEALWTAILALPLDEDRSANYRVGFAAARLEAANLVAAYAKGEEE